MPRCSSLSPRSLALIKTDFFDAEALDFSQDTPPAGANPHPGPGVHVAQEAPQEVVGPLPDRPGVYRQLFFTVWRGEGGGASTFRYDPGVVRFCEGQRERCPDTGRIHEHYWIAFRRPVRIGTAKSCFDPPLEQGGYDGKRVWGTNRQVYDYVRKVASGDLTLPPLPRCLSCRGIRR